MKEKVHKSVLDYAAKFGLRVERRDDGHYLLLDPDGEVVNTSFYPTANSAIQMMERHLGRSVHGREVWLAQAVIVLAKELELELPADWSVVLGPETETRKGGNITVAVALTETADVLRALAPEVMALTVGGDRDRYKELVREVKARAGRRSLDQVLARLAKRLPKYPHHYEYKGTTWVRMVSTNDDDYTTLVSPKKLEEMGPPLDPWGEPMIPRWRVAG